MTVIGLATTQPSRRIAAGAAAALWALLVVLWPVSSNVFVPPGEELGRGAGEGLYKAAPVTSANFGMLGVRLYQTTDGKKRWAIKAEFAELHRKENYSFLKTVNAKFTAERTGNEVVTTSKYGRSQLDRDSIDLEGDVSILSKRGYFFSMDRLHYDGPKHEFTSEDAVKMLGPDVARPRMILRGTGLLADIDSEHFYLRKNVSALRRLASAEGEKSNAPQWLRIVSRSGEFFTEEQRSLFITKVHAQMPKLELDSDVLELSLAQEKETMQAQGNVLLRSRERIGHADTAYLELGSNRIILEGRARVDSKDNQVRGRRILLYTDEDRVEVEEAEGRGKG